MSMDKLKLIKNIHSLIFEAFRHRSVPNCPKMFRPKPFKTVDERHERFWKCFKNKRNTVEFFSILGVFLKRSIVLKIVFFVIFLNLWFT